MSSKRLLAGEFDELLRMIRKQTQERPTPRVIFPAYGDDTRLSRR